MLRHLQTIVGKNIDAQKTAKTNMKRGTFVSIDEEKGQLVVATATADVVGVVVRDVIVDEDVARGTQIAELSDSQDLIKAGEFAGIEVPQKGERYATTEFGDATALPEVNAKAGQTLDVANGKLVKAVESSTSNIISLGFMSIAGTKYLGFKFV